MSLFVLPCSRRYGAGANNVKVHTSEQVKQLLAALADEKDDNGKNVSPFTYAETYDEMYAALMTKDKPVLQVSKQTDIITVRGRIWPLEEFLQSIGFIKMGNEMIVTASAATENGGFDAVLADVKLLAETYGWMVEEA